MGVQIQTYAIYLEDLSKEWNAYKKTLRQNDQVFFDDFFRIAKLNVQAGNIQASPYPFETAMFTVILHLLKRANELESNLQIMQSKYERLNS